MPGNINGNKQVDGEGMQVSCTLHFKGSKRLISETCIKQTPSGNAVVSKGTGVFLSVNPKTDFRCKNGFRVPFGKSKSGFLIW